MENYTELVAKYKLKLKDVAWGVAMNNVALTHVQRKFDGFWTMSIFENGKHTVVSSGSAVRKEASFFMPDLGKTIILGEWMYGTTWGKKYHKDTGIEFIFFDMVMYDGEDITQEPYKYRLECCREFIENHGHPGFDWARMLHKSADLQKSFSGNKAFEGVVWRSSDGAFSSQVFRTKTNFTMDYVCMGFTPGGGKYASQVGSVIGGLYIDGVVTAVCKVGGLSEAHRKEFTDHPTKYINRVFEAKGKKLFKSGALRHPGFLRWREDKMAKECKLG